MTKAKGSGLGCFHRREIAEQRLQPSIRCEADQRAAFLAVGSGQGIDDLGNGQVQQR
ncbi:hypothetical protein D9M69_705710 [compost metagenome]